VTPGSVVALQLAAAKGAPMRQVESVRAVPGEGLLGDRYFGQTRGDRVAAVTLIESEALEALERDYGVRFAFSATRRNILTRGVSLNALLGQRFRVGEVVLQATGLCEPCWHIAAADPRVLRGLLQRGGLRADILSEGMIGVGDAIREVAAASLP
jgi:MOSC domain-containing protein YiiM